MSASRLVIVGGGEHARVVAEAAAASPGEWDVSGYTDAGDAGTTPTSRDPRRPDAPYLGNDEALLARLRDPSADSAACLVLGFGGPAGARRRAVEAFGPVARWATIVHPAAWVSPTAILADGAVILAGAVVNAGARIGPHAIVNSRAVIEHDVIVGGYTHVAPGATIGGGTVIGEDAFIGLGAAVRDHITIGARAVVGMGGVVVTSVAAEEVVTGVPARPRHSGRG